MAVIGDGKTGKMHLKCSLTLAEIEKISIKTTKHDFFKNLTTLQI